MNKEMISSMIKKALDQKDAMITDIYPIAEGMTNVSFFVTINGKKFILRIPGLGTTELVNRREEKENLLLGTALGINPKHIYFNDETGIKVTEKIENATNLTPTIAKEDQMITRRVIALIKHLHDSKTVMKNRFELFNVLTHYEDLVERVNPVILDKLTLLKKEVADLKVIYESFSIVETPCHIDIVCTNIMMSGEELFLIDWEYSGMFDPLWDLSTLFVSLELTDEEKLFSLLHYLGREPYEEEMQRMLMHTIFQDYLWSLWSFYKEAIGDNVGSVGMLRYERGMDNVSLYKELYDEEIVV